MDERAVVVVVGCMGWDLRAIELEGCFGVCCALGWGGSLVWMTESGEMISGFCLFVFACWVWGLRNEKRMTIDETEGTRGVRKKRFEEN